MEEDTCKEGMMEVLRTENQKKPKTKKSWCVNMPFFLNFMPDSLFLSQLAI